MDLQGLSEACDSNPTDPSPIQALITYCKDLLNSSSTVAVEVIKALADLARNTLGREKILDSGLVQQVSVIPWTSDHNLVVELCRLSGNLCYDCPLGREVVSQAGMLDRLANTVQNLDKDNHSRVWSVLPAFLHNYCADNLQCLNLVENLAKVASDYFSRIDEAMDSSISNEDSEGDVNEQALESYASFLAGLTEHEGKIKFFSLGVVVKSISSILNTSSSEETLVSMLELLQDIFEDESVSNVYVEQNVVSLLLSKINSWPSDVVTCSLDLFALLSSHASVLPRILHSSSPLHTAVTEWFTTQPSPHHTATAALIYGNFCTTDESCLQLLSTTIPPVLVTLLSPSSPQKLLHAVIGCLRNLSVCLAAREQLLGLFLPEASCQLLVHLSQGSDHTVTPKVLSTLRLVTQGDQTSCERIGMDTSLIRDIIKIAGNSLIPALNIEATRLLSSVIRYSKSSAVVENAINADATPLVLGLLNSPHPQLLNESLVALNLAAANRPPSAKIVEQIDIEFLGSKIFDIMKMENCPKEIKSNAVTLVKNIMEWNFTGINDALARSELKNAIFNFESES